MVAGLHARVAGENGTGPTSIPSHSSREVAKRTMSVGDAQSIRELLRGPGVRQSDDAAVTVVLEPHSAQKPGRHARSRRGTLSRDKGIDT